MKTSKTPSVKNFAISRDFKILKTIAGEILDDKLSKKLSIRKRVENELLKYRPVGAV